MANNNLTTEIAEGLAGRLRTLARSLDRLDRLESGSGKWLSNFRETELPASAAFLILRALHTASEPTNYQILITLSQNPSLPLSRLLESSSLTRLPLSERLNDLVQVGLATRLIDTDHAQITAAGAKMVEWIAGLVEEVMEVYKVDK